jgi:hypothetical protein
MRTMIILTPATKPSSSPTFRHSRVFAKQEETLGTPTHKVEIISTSYRRENKRNRERARVYGDNRVNGRALLHPADRQPKAMLGRAVKALISRYNTGMSDWGQSTNTIKDTSLPGPRREAWRPTRKRNRLMAIDTWLTQSQSRNQFHKLVTYNCVFLLPE